MYSKGKIISVSLIAMAVLAIGIVKEGVLGKEQLTTAENTITVSAEKTSTTETHPQHKGGKHGFESMLKELQESGTLTADDVKKIEEYNKVQMENHRNEMKEKRNEQINNMVKENVITKEKAQKIIEALDKKMQEFDKKIEN